MTKTLSLNEVWHWRPRSSFLQTFTTFSLKHWNWTKQAIFLLKSHWNFNLRSCVSQKYLVNNARIPKRWELFAGLATWRVTYATKKIFILILGSSLLLGSSSFFGSPSFLGLCSLLRSECSIAQLSLQLFVIFSCCSRYVGFFDLIHVNDNVKIWGYKLTDKQSSSSKRRIEFSQFLFGSTHTCHNIQSQMLVLLRTTK